MRGARRFWEGWSLSLVFVAASLIASPTVSASSPAADNYEKARELHAQRRFAEAAGRFMVSFETGYRQETSAYNAACALARAGLRKMAFEWLYKALAAGFDLAGYLDEDPDLRPLRSDPRFAALRARVMPGRPAHAARGGDETVRRLDALRAQPGARAEAFDQLGRELLRAGRYSEAADAFLTAAARDDSPAKSLYNAACALSLRGDRAAAVATLRRAVEAGFADAAHLDEDDDLDAIRHEPGFADVRALAQALDVPDYPSQPRDRDARSRHAWQAALPRIEAAVRSHPQLGHAWYNLGYAHLALGQPEQAIAPFERAIDLGFRKGTSTYNLACAYALAGHRDEALAALERSFQAGFDSWGLLRSDGDLDGLRSDPRFQALLERAREHQRGS